MARNKSGHFIKGESGNPVGRPVVPQEQKDIRLMALKYADDALQVLVKVLPMVDSQPASAISAAKELLDRGFGKSTQHTTAEIKVTHHDARDRLEQKLVGVDREEAAPEPDRVTH